MSTQLPWEAETQSYRELFPHCQEGVVYVNHAAVSPLPTPVAGALEQYVRRRSSGQTGLEWELEQVARARKLLAGLIGAPSEETIALMPNTTLGLSTVALALQWVPGESVLVGAQEFPAVVYPWRALQRFGVRLRFLPMPGGELPVERIAEELDASVRVVVVSAVQFLSGYRVDMEALGHICRERGVLLVVDGMQAVGALQLDVQRMQIGALACGGAKWLMAPHGSGFLYVAPDLLQRLVPGILGWLAAANPWDFFAFEQPLAPTARRFEGGSLDMGAIAGLCAALELLHAYGPERAQERVLALSTYLWERLRAEFPGLPVLTPAHPERRAGIVTFGVGSPEKAAALVQELAQRRIVCSARLEYVRFSPHWYNTAEELEHIVETLRDILGVTRQQKVVS